MIQKSEKHKRKEKLIIVFNYLKYKVICFPQRLYSFKLPKPKGRAKHNYTAEAVVLSRSIIVPSVKPSKGESCEPLSLPILREREREWRKRDERKRWWWHQGKSWERHPTWWQGEAPTWRPTTTWSTLPSLASAASSPLPPTPPSRIRFFHNK